MGRMKHFRKKLNKRVVNKRVLKVIELCAGIGQTSIALEQACRLLGIKMTIEAFCEIDKYASQAYRALHPNVMKCIEDMKEACFEGMYCDILLATTPCQGFSALGKKDGFKDVEGNESAIIWHTFRLIDELVEKPKLIFFENVKGMISKKNKEDFQIFENELKKRGYTVHYKVLDAQKFNVPQHRERIYIIATLDNVSFDFPKEEILNVFLKDILEEDIDPRFMMAPTMGDQITRTNERGRSVRVHNPKYANVAYTLCTKSRGQNNSNYIFVDDVSRDSVIRFTPNDGGIHDELKKLPMRSLTRIEQGRLMGMRDEDIHKLDFICDTRFSKMMGNGVVIPVVRKVFVNVLKAYVEQYDDFLKKEPKQKVA